MNGNYTERYSRRDVFIFVKINQTVMVTACCDPRKEETLDMSDFALNLCSRISV